MNVPLRAGALASAALWVASALLAAPPVAAAARPPSPPTALDWADVVRMVDEHPAVSAARRTSRAAAAHVEEAMAAPNPTLGAGVGQGIARYGDETRVEWGVSLGVPLDWLYRRGYARDVATAELEATRAAAAAARLAVLDRLRERFWRVAGAQADVVDLTALEDGAGALLAAVSARVEHGAARPVEEVQARAELESVRLDLARARSVLEARRAELAAALGLAADRALRVAADPAEAPPLPDRAALLAAVRARHPAIREDALAVRVREAAVAEERSHRLPALEVAPFYESELDRDAWGVEVGVTLPLWNWNGAGVARAEEERAAAAERAAATLREVEAAVVAAHGRCATRRDTVERYAERVLPPTREAAAAQEERYRLGEAGLLVAIDARRSLLGARRAWRQALLDAWLDCSRLALLAEELGDAS